MKDRFLLADCFPGATSWGVLNGVSNQPNRWVCPSCGSFRRLLVLNGLDFVFCDCLDCWLHTQDQRLAPFVQLTLGV